MDGVKVLSGAKPPTMTGGRRRKSRSGGRKSRKANRKSRRHHRRSQKQQW